MAATRLTLSNPKVRRETFAEWCPTCGTKNQRDGRLGAFNRTNFCSPPCYSKFRSYTRAKRLNAAGSGSTAQFIYGSIPPKEIS